MGGEHFFCRRTWTLLTRTTLCRCSSSSAPIFVLRECTFCTRSTCVHRQLCSSLANEASRRSLCSSLTHSSSSECARRLLLPSARTEVEPLSQFSIQFLVLVSATPTVEKIITIAALPIIATCLGL